MTRAEWEWLFAWSLLNAGKVTAKWIQECTQLSFGEDHLMTRCKRCKGMFFSVCTDCEYRKGGRMVEDRDDTERDTLTGFILHHRYWHLYNTLEWMRVQTPLEQ